MHQDTFRAKYTFSFWLGAVALFLIGIGLIVSAIMNVASLRRLDVMALGLAAILLGVLLGQNVKIVEFGSDRLVVYRLWFPKKEMPYAQIVDVGSTLIQSREWTFRYGSLVNHQELRQQVGMRIGLGQIPRPQRGSRLDREDDRRWMPIAVGGFLGATLYILLSWSGLVEGLDGVQKIWVYFGCFFAGWLAIAVVQRLGARQRDG